MISKIRVGEPVDVATNVPGLNSLPKCYCMCYCGEDTYRLAGVIGWFGEEGVWN